MTIRQNTNSVHSIGEATGEVKADMKIPDIYIFPVKVSVCLNVKR